MALNISSSQIYAGRYHYKRPEIPNLLDTQKYTASTPGKSVKEATGVDTVTISDEGLAKAKDWREYTKDNENISHTGVNPKEELYKELNTVNNIDTASMFNCELGEVADQIQKENGLGDHSRSQEEFLTVMAKAYQVIYDRIDEEFSDPDRDPPRATVMKSRRQAGLENSISSVLNVSAQPPLLQTLKLLRLQNRFLIHSVLRI